MPKRKKTRLTARSRHAVTAMVQIMQQDRDKPVPLSQIASASDISLSYLEQLFAGLRRHGLVKSFRGPGGGYLLAKPANDIPVTDILLSAEGGAPAKHGKTDERVVLPDSPQIRDFWNHIDELLYACLKHISLADVADGRLDTHPVLNNLFETLD